MGLRGIGGSAESPSLDEVVDDDSSAILVCAFGDADAIAAASPSLSLPMLPEPTLLPVLALPLRGLCASSSLMSSTHSKTRGALLDSVGNVLSVFVTPQPDGTVSLLDLWLS